VHDAISPGIAAALPGQCRAGATAPPAISAIVPALSMKIARRPAVGAGRFASNPSATAPVDDTLVTVTDPSADTTSSTLTRT